MSEEANAEEVATPDYMEMSDEDFANLAEEFPDEEASIGADDEVDDEKEESPDEGTDTEAEGDDDDEEPDTGESSEDESTDDAADDDEPSDDEGEADEAPDFENEYKKLTAPFKANGKDMQIDNVDDAIKLMQMGANYNRKMAAMKPGLKALKMLEKNGLLDEEKLSYLIDLDKQNPEAITKLLKDSKIDTLDLDLEQENEYRAPDYSVDDREIELDSVIAEIRDTSTYNRTLDVVAEKWDASSKQIVADQPQLLKVINDHMASGVYDLISTEVERERMFGRLGDVSNIEAYRTVGDAMQEQGAFNHLGNPKAAKPDSVVAPKAKGKDDTKRREKRRAASPTKPAASSSKKADFNPLALSDEDFMKQHDPNLL